MESTGFMEPGSPRDHTVGVERAWQKAAFLRCDSTSGYTDYDDER
jgi:hypothetical protein